MRRPLILPIILVLSTLGADFHAARAQDRTITAARLVLFGAHWCAPCRAEAVMLPALVTAAAPTQVVIAWIDRPLPLPAGLPMDRIAALSPATAEALATHIGGEGYGLPFTASFDGDGRLCGVRRKPLRPDDVAALLAACQH